MALAVTGTIVIGLDDSCSLAGTSLSCPPLSDFIAGSAFLGNFLALLGALTVAGYLMIGRRLRAKVDLIPYIFVIYSVAAIALVIYMFVAGQTPIGYPQSTYLWILALALIPQLIGHSTYNWALKFMPASLVSVTTLGEPIGSAILALLLLGETPSAITLVGGILILIGIYLTTKATT
jgi:drug/metabolite transporter (DMT)-like permease